MYWRRSENGFVHVCGHRGHSVAAPENTAAALRANKAHGGTTAEIDTVLTGDGRIVMIHDLTLDRTTDGTGAVRSYDMAKLKRLDAGSWFSDEFSGERLLELREVLELARDLDLGLEIEVKEKLDLAGFTRVLERELADPNDLERIMLISFDHVYLKAAKAAIPGLRTGGICHARYADPVGVARAADLDELCIDLAVFSPVDARDIQSAGIAIRCHAYNPIAMARAAAAGIDWRPLLVEWAR